MVYPAEAIRRRKIKAFRDWLLPLAEVQAATKAAA
jgi:LysR family glycine cleavage system transcriptional activator